MHPILQEWRSLDTGRKALRSFGLVVGGVFVGIALVLWWRGGFVVGPWSVGLGGVGATLMLFGVAAPLALRAPYRVWMLLAVVLGFIMTRVLLTLVFLLAVLPIGLLRRALGHDPMRRRPADSYWQPRTDSPPSPDRLTKYY